VLTYILLTERCNLSCSHCIRGERVAGDLSMTDFASAVSQVVEEYPTSGFVLTGGEPTLNAEFSEMLDYLLLDHRREVILNSNGTTKFYEGIVKYAGFKNLHVQFSIDGAPSEHDDIRGSGTFHKLRNNMDALRDAGMKIWVSTVVTERNIGSMDALRELMVEYNVEKWHVNPVLPFGCGATQHAVPIETWNNFVSHLIDTTPLRLGVKKLYDFSSLKRKTPTQLEKIKEDVRLRCTCNCGCGNLKLYVYPDLSVYGCTCIKTYPFGNLHNSTLREVMTSDVATEIRNYRLEPDSPCQKCPYVSICNGGCIGMSLHEFGRLGVGDSRCPIFRTLSI